MGFLRRLRKIRTFFNTKDKKETKVQPSKGKRFGLPDFEIPGLEIKSELGRGVHGAAYKVNYNGKIACAKKFTHQMDKKVNLEMKNESRMMKAAEISGYTPKLLSTENEQKLIIMELCQGQNLLEFIKKKPTLEEIHQVCSKVMEAICQLNSAGVIHNDLKADNIMVQIKKNIFRKTEFDIKIIDFGFAKFSGEAPYPEVSLKILKKCPQLDPSLAEGGSCSKFTDLYSLGELFKQIYKIGYNCPVYERCWKLFQSHNGDHILPEHLLAKNCKTCGQKKFIKKPKNIRVKECIYSGNISFNSDLSIRIDNYPEFKGTAKINSKAECEKSYSECGSIQIESDPECRSY